MLAAELKGINMDNPSIKVHVGALGWERRYVFLWAVAIFLIYGFSLQH